MKWKGPLLVAFWFWSNVFCFVCISVDRIDNSRIKSLEFEIKTSFTLHGFAGYFEAILYKDIMISKSTLQPKLCQVCFGFLSARLDICRHAMRATWLSQSERYLPYQSEAVCLAWFFRAFHLLQAPTACFCTGLWLAIVLLLYLHAVRISSLRWFNFNSLTRLLF